MCVLSSLTLDKSTQSGEEERKREREWMCVLASKLKEKHAGGCRFTLCVCGNIALQCRKSMKILLINSFPLPLALLSHQHTLNNFGVATVSYGCCCTN